MNTLTLLGKIDRIERDLALARLAWESGRMITFRYHLTLACREYQPLESTYHRLFQRFENEVQSLCASVMISES